MLREGDHDAFRATETVGEERTVHDYELKSRSSGLS